MLCTLEVLQTIFYIEKVLVPQVFGKYHRKS